MGEALRLTWSSIRNDVLSLDNTKSGKVRHIPLSRVAKEWLRNLGRIVGVPWVFHRRHKQRKSIKEIWAVVKKDAGVDCRFHDLCHYRGTTWVRNGVDIRTVQALLGHADIHTTMRYAHFAQDHAFDAVRRAEQRERDENVTRDVG